jgi:hypothetical protein
MRFSYRALTFRRNTLVLWMTLSTFFSSVAAFGQWQGWEDLSNGKGALPIGGTPTVIEVAHFPEIYVVSDKGTLLSIHTNRTVPLVWTWDDLGGHVTGKPECARTEAAPNSLERVDCFVTGPGYDCQHEFRKDPSTGKLIEMQQPYCALQVSHIARLDGHWTAWDVLAGSISSTISVVKVPAPGVLELFGTVDGLLAQNEYNGSSWTGWIRHPLGSLADGPTSGPSCVWAQLAIHCFARGRGASNQLIYSAWNGTTWQVWQPVANAGPMNGQTSPSASSSYSFSAPDSAPLFDVFYSGPDYKMNHVWQDSSGIKSEILDGHSLVYSCSRIGISRNDCVVHSWTGTDLLHDAWLAPAPVVDYFTSIGGLDTNILSWKIENKDCSFPENCLFTLSGPGLPPRAVDSNDRLSTPNPLPHATITYSLVVQNSWQKATHTTTIVVSPPPPPPVVTVPVISSFKASPNNGALPNDAYIDLGSTATLSWTVTGCTAHCNVSIVGNDGLNYQDLLMAARHVRTSGSFKVTPTRSTPTKYTMLATDDAGQATADALVNLYSVSQGGGTVFYFRMSNSASQVTPCFTIAVYATTQGQAEGIAAQQNGGYTPAKISYQEFVNGC